MQKVISEAYPIQLPTDGNLLWRRMVYSERLHTHAYCGVLCYLFTGHTCPDGGLNM